MRRLLDPPVFIGAILIAAILVSRLVNINEPPRPEPTEALLAPHYISEATRELAIGRRSATRYDTGVRQVPRL